jgi:xanthine dehydrogenase molybdenum-binding subunit
MNPDTVNGQQYGGAYMGVSRSNMEECYYDPLTGVTLNDDMIFYPIALMNDVGPIDCHIVETGQGYGAYGAAGIGENIGVTMSSCTIDAIYNATGKWLEHRATTPDRVLKMLGKI